MKKSKFTQAQRTQILAKLASGQKAEELSREYQVSTATLYKWRKDSETEENEDKMRLKRLEAENAQLKKMYAELSLDHKILQTGYEMVKKFQAREDKKLY